MIVEREMQVKYPNGTEAHDLNELEYVNGTIFANVFVTMEIVNIDESSFNSGVMDTRSYSKKGEKKYIL